MIEFNQSVQLRHPSVLQTGELDLTATAIQINVVRKENEFSDDHHGTRQKLEFFAPYTASLYAGDTITFDSKTYEVTRVKVCRDIDAGRFILRCEAVC